MDDLNIYEYVIKRLRMKHVSRRKIAAETGVPFSTLSKIAQGQIKNPSVRHAQALYNYFKRIEALERREAA